MSYMSGLIRVFLLCFLFATFEYGCAQTQSDGSKSFVQWASKNAIPIESIVLPLPEKSVESLRIAIGPAKVVGLGESRHDTREQALLKGLIVRHMIKDLGFRAFILEESGPHAEPLDRYVYSGEGDLRLIMNELAGWYLWDSEEMLELFQWMRQFNDGREEINRVRVFGMDITAPALGVTGVMNFLDDAGIEFGFTEQELGLDLQRGDFWPGTWERYSAQSEDQRTVLEKNYEYLVEILVKEKQSLVAASSEDEFERMLLMAEIGRFGNTFFSSTGPVEGGVIREQGMAATALWYLNMERPETKAIIWAHNLHVATSTFSMPEMMEGTFSPMGMQMRETLGDAYISIGAAFGEGSYPDDLPPGQRQFEILSGEAIDGALARIGLPYFLIDLREVKHGSEEGKWLNEERAWRAQDAEAFLVPAASFDLVYFVKTISRAQLTPLALERYQSMRD